MGKKSRAKKPVAAAATRPSGEQEGLIAFIQQLMREQRYPEALRAGRALVESYPLDPLAHAVLGSVLAQFNNVPESLRQFELAERLGMGDDPMILQSIAVTASAARYPIHALRAARAGARLKQATPEQQRLFTTVIGPTSDYLRGLVGGTSLPPDVAEEAMLAVEQSQRALADGERERARRLMEDATALAPHWPVVWNQLANLLFQFNDLPGAIAACNQVLTHVDADEPLILSSLTRFYAVSGRAAEAEASVRAILALPDADASLREEQARALAILARDQEIYDRLAPLPAQGAEGLHPVGRYLLGVAAANLGKLDEARDAWRNVWRDGLVHGRTYAEIIARHERPPTPNGHFSYFSAGELVPVTLLDELATQVHPAQNAERLREIAQAFPCLPEALCETFYAPGVDPRIATDLLLMLRDGYDGVVEAVRTFATSRAAGDSHRVYAHIALRAAGLEDREAPAPVWIDGRQRALALPSIRLAVVPERNYPAEVDRLFTEATEAQERDDARGAAEIYRRLLEIDPDLAEAEHNLGTALLLSGDFAEGTQHLERALDLDPNHVLARCNLASMAITRGDVSSAHALLDPLDGREAFTLEEILAYLRVRADLALADGETDRGEALLQALLAFDPGNELAKERLARLRETSPATGH